MHKHWLIAALALVLTSLAAPIAPAHGAAPVPAGPAWRDTHLTLPKLTPDQHRLVCFDAAHPHVLVSAVPGTGTVAYQWPTATQTVLNTRLVRTCGPDGLFFADDPAGAWRFSLDDPEGQAIAHLPAWVAADGTRQVYAPAAPDSATDPKLWYTPDSGLTWEPRLAGLNRQVGSVVVSPLDARVLYVQTWTPWSRDYSAPDYQTGFTYIRSTDTGRTWTDQGTIRENPTIAGPSASIHPLSGRAGSVDTMLKIASAGGGSPRVATLYDVSTDGARTFHELGSRRWTEGHYHDIQGVQTAEGIVRLAFDQTDRYDSQANGQVYNTTHTLERASDPAGLWQPLPLPFPQTVSGSRAASEAILRVADASPADLFLAQGPQLYHSGDNGHTWEQLPDFSGEAVGDYPDNQLYITPYLPLALLDIRPDGPIWVLDLPAAGQHLPAPAAATNAPDSRRFAETGHNLGVPFAAYWGQHGGLVQQGYPLSEPVRQSSSTDGKLYTMQYFERAVFEYHPENPAPYNVLLSLLGVAAYRQRYGEAGAPGQHPSVENPRVFPETGHTLGGKFRAYWESHGGLAQQGYPLSDEFTEVNALDGKPYTVQYFERAVFEWHPENAGTPYEVLLSQLGTAQLRADRPPAPRCATTPDAAFRPIWDGNPALVNTLGCPQAAGMALQTATQLFERGRMLWVDHGPQGDPAIFALFDDGHYQYILDTYKEGEPDACSAAPPAGRVLPRRGFNKIWCNTYLRSSLGWPLAPEAGSPGTAQAFAQGWLYSTTQGRQVLALGPFDSGTQSGPIHAVFVAGTP